MFSAPNGVSDGALDAEGLENIFDELAPVAGNDLSDEPAVVRFRRVRWNRVSQLPPSQVVIRPGEQCGDYVSLSIREPSNRRICSLSRRRQSVLGQGGDEPHVPDRDGEAMLKSVW